MPISRIYQPVALANSMTLQLDEKASHHLARVLRAKENETIILFNGDGYEYEAKITQIHKKFVEVSIFSAIEKNTESPIELCLAQGIARGEKMDFIVQKAVELGVKKIVPLVTERCNVRLDQEREEKRRLHWQAVIISACEQSGRTVLPQLLPPQTLADWLASEKVDYGLVLSPHHKGELAEIAFSPRAKIALLIGPEGGLSEQEVQVAINKGFLPLNLGPRILRTETATIAALAILQANYGDI